MSLSFFQLIILISRISVNLTGIIGSIISFIVLCRKAFRNNSINTYGRAFALFNCLSIIQLIKDAYRFTNQTIQLNNSDVVACKIFFYLWMQFTSIPGWMFVAFSVDNTLNMRTSPQRIIKSKWFQSSVITGIVLFNLLLYSELLFSLKLEPIGDNYECNIIFISYYNIFVYVELFASCLIPFTIMIVSSSVTIKLLWKSRSLLLERNGLAFKKRKNRDVRYAVSSVVFNMFFIVTKLPFMIAPFSNSVYFLEVSILLLLINCSSVFFIHLAINSIFRRELLLLIGLFKKPTNSQTHR